MARTKKQAVILDPPVPTKDTRSTVGGLVVEDKDDGARIAYGPREGQALLVEDPALACPWCDGTGLFCKKARHTKIEWTTCWACDGQGRKP